MIARRTIGTGLLAMALSWSGPLAALTPPLPCTGEEGGMHVEGAAPFGFDGSGFTVEGYWNIDAGKGGSTGPIPQLNHFIGLRITDCRSGQFVAIHGTTVPDALPVLTATEFLRSKVQGKRRFSLGDVARAARAVYAHNDYYRVLKLRETEETCACREYFPGLWK